MVGAFRTPDLREPFAVTEATGGTATLQVETNRTYYVAAWYVKDPADGRDHFPASIHFHGAH